MPKIHNYIDISDYKDDELQWIRYKDNYVSVGMELPKSLLFDTKYYDNNAIRVKVNSFKDEYENKRVVEKSLLKGSFISFVIKSQDNRKYAYLYYLVNWLGRRCWKSYKKTGQRLFTIKTDKLNFVNHTWQIKDCMEKEFIFGFFSELESENNYKDRKYKLLRKSSNVWVFYNLIDIEDNGNKVETITQLLDELLENKMLSYE